MLLLKYRQSNKNYIILDGWDKLSPVFRNV